MPMCRQAIRKVSSKGDNTAASSVLLTYEAKRPDRDRLLRCGVSAVILQQPGEQVGSVGVRLSRRRAALLLLLCRCDIAHVRDETQRYKGEDANQQSAGMQHSLLRLMRAWRGCMETREVPKHDSTERSVPYWHTFAACSWQSARTKMCAQMQHVQDVGFVGDEPPCDLDRRQAAHRRQRTVVHHLLQLVGSHVEPKLLHSAQIC